MQRFAYVLNHVYIWGIMFVLLGAFWMQFYAKEFPCPLCLLQRMCMILAAIGPAYVLMQMREEDDREERLIDVGMGFGMSILAALAGMAVSTRQVLLHIAPGDPGYGSAVMGLHLYTWALIVFAVVIFVSGLTLVFQRSLTVTEPHDHWFTRLTLACFALVILANAFSSLAIAGWNLYLPDNPTSYLLFS